MTQARKKTKGAGEADLFSGPVPGKRDWDGLASIYGKSVRTLKRYDQDGREAGDPPMLEDPVKMREWWQKHMKQQVPGWLLKASVAVKVEKAALAKAPEPGEEEEEEEGILEDIPDDEMGLEKTLERLAMAEVRFSKKAHQPGQNKAWLDTIARMGPLAEKLRIEHERQRKLIPVADAEKLIHEFHGPIERETRQLARTMCEVTGIPCTPHVLELWNKECDRLFARFQQEVFR